MGRSGTSPSEQYPFQMTGHSMESLRFIYSESQVEASNSTQTDIMTGDMVTDYEYRNLNRSSWTPDGHPGKQFRTCARLRHTGELCSGDLGFSNIKAWSNIIKSRRGKGHYSKLKDGLAFSRRPKDPSTGQPRRKRDISRRRNEAPGWTANSRRRGISGGPVNEKHTLTGKTKGAVTGPSGKRFRKGCCTWA